MDADHTPQAAVPRLAPGGELNIYTVAGLRTQWLQALQQHDAIEIDLGAIDDIDTAGLQLMLMATRCPGKTVRFVNPADAVRGLAALANLGALFGDVPPATGSA